MGTSIPISMTDSRHTKNHVQNHPINLHCGLWKVVSKPNRVFNCILISPVFLTKRLTRERQMVFCTSRSCDSSRTMTGSRKSSGKEIFTASHISVAMTYLNEGRYQLCNHTRDSLPILFKPKNLNCHLYAKYEVYLKLQQAEALYQL